MEETFSKDEDVLVVTKSVQETYSREALEAEREGYVKQLENANDCIARIDALLAEAEKLGL